MATNPNNAIGTNAAFGGRTSPNALNDVLSAFDGRGILSGWQCLPSNNMVVTVGGDSSQRDVAIAEDNAGNKLTINNISQQPVEVEIQTASSTSASTDYIVAYIDNPPQGSATVVDNPAACGLIDVRGSGTAAPTDQQIRAEITSDGGTGTTAYYVVLATITVPVSATTLTSSNITQGAMSHINDYAALESAIEDIKESTKIIYSEEERVVGTWMGKDLYAKVLTGQAENAEDNSFSTGLSTAQISEITPLSCVCMTHSTGGETSFPGYDGKSYGYRMEFSNNNGTIYCHIKHTYGAWGGRRIRVVLFYTKNS